MCDPDDDNDGVLDLADICAETVIPESVPLSGSLGNNRFALYDNDTTFDIGTNSGPVPSDIAIADTGGCSCEQLLTISGGSTNAFEFGCRASDMSPPDCGDFFCDPATEDACVCPQDCGVAPLSEISGLTCSDSIDNDCDGRTDCADQLDCRDDFACSCEPKNADCTVDNECCSLVCKNNGRCQ